MSIQRQVEVQCRSCGLAQPFTVWDSLNATLNPEAKAALLNDELFTLRCRECEAESPVVYDMLFHDMEGRYMIWLSQSGEIDLSSMEPLTRMFNQAGTPYRLRVVRHPSRLAERVRIMDDGWDDCIMESIKSKLRIDLAQQLPPNAMTALYYAAVRDTPNGREVAFNFLVQGKGSAPVVIHWDETYGQWESAMARWLQTAHSGNDEWIELNDQTVLELLRQFSQAPKDESIEEG